MSKEYKVTAVSPQTKEWDSQYGSMITYYVKVDGESEAVQLNKKADSPAPRVGDELYGDVTSTEYGLKFKAQKKPFSGGYKGQPRDDEAIKAQWALGRAYEKHGATQEALKDAEWLFSHIDSLKNFKTKELVDYTRTTKAVFKQDEVHEPTDEDLAALNDLGF